MKYLILTIAILAIQGAYTPKPAPNAWIAPLTPPPALILENGRPI